MSSGRPTPLGARGQPPPEKPPMVKSRWQKAASTVLRTNKVARNVNAFLNETKRSMHTSNTHDRHDLARVRDALASADVAAVEFLLARDRADLHAELDAATGEFPIHVAAAALRDPRTRDQAGGMLRWLVDKHHVDIEAADGLGRSALHVAANGCDDPQVVLMLLARGADPRAQTPAGDVAADLAKLQRHAHAKAVLDAAAAAGNSIAFAHGHPGLPASLLPRLDPTRTQIDWGPAEAAEALAATTAAHEHGSPHGSPHASRHASAQASAHPSREPSSATSCQEASGPSPQPSLAALLATKLRAQARQTEWAPPPHLQVVQRANAGALAQQQADARATRAAMFVDTLQRRTLGAGSPYLLAMMGDA